MTCQLNDREQTILECEHGLTEITDAEAVPGEGQDYAMHFCGLDCFDAWRNRGDDTKSADSADVPSQ